MEPQAFVPIVGIVGSIGSVVFIVWVVASFLSRRQQVNAAASFHAKLLDRLGSTKDFSDFMNSDGGARFLDTLSLQRENGPQERVLRATASGIVLTILGIGLAMFSGEIPSRREFALGVGFLSAISLSLGIGLLLAAGLTERLARRFGLIRPTRSDQEPPVR
jgi:hypothetical protein